MIDALSPHLFATQITAVQERVQELAKQARTPGASLTELASSLDVLALQIDERRRQHYWLAEFMEAAPVGFAVFIEREQRLLWANDVFTRRMLSTDGSAARPDVRLLACCPAPIRADVESRLSEIAESGRPYVSPEFTMDDAAHGTSYWQLVFFVLPKRPLAPPSFLAVLHNVTERVNALRQAEAERARLRTILDTLPVGVFLADADGRILESNGMACRIWGGDTPLAESVADYDVYHGWYTDTGKPVVADDWALARAIKDGETSVGEVIDLLRFDGTHATILNNAAPIRDAEGRITGAVSVIQDITALQQAKAERGALLAQVERHAAELDAIIEGTDAHLAVLDEQFNFLMVNSAYAESTGYPREALIGNNHFALFPHAEYAEIFAQVRATGIPYRANEAPYTYHNQPERGVTYWNWQLGPMPPVAGQEQRFLLSLTEVTPQVTSRQQAELFAARVERHAAELDAAITSMTDGIIIYNPEGQVVRMNPVAERILGYSAEERALPVSERLRRRAYQTAKGQPFTADDFPSTRALRGETVHGELIAMTVDGKQHWHSSSAAPIRMPDGRTLGAVATFTDITALRELQLQQELFVHTISHDLRAPLTSIQGYAQLLEMFADAAQNSRLAPMVDAISRSVRRMNVMIEDLVDAARLDGQQLTLQRQILAPETYLPRLLERSALVLDLARVTLDIPPDLPPMHADPNRLERILLNLLSNAFKYSPADTPVHIRVRREDSAVVVSVHDQGVGIAPEEQEHLFERFYRAKRARKADGLGLGLYITKMLVEAHGGTIGVESAQGQGSCFFFTVPAMTT